MASSISKSKISWEEYAARLAQTASLRSEDPYVKVGACALGRGNKVLSLGYNGLASSKQPPKDFWNSRDRRRKFMIHAEANCLSMFEAGDCDLLATTLLPCSYCATMIAAYRIPKVIYIKEYERDIQSKEIFNFYGIKLSKISVG